MEKVPRSCVEIKRSSESPLVLGLPSKGRLQQGIVDLLSRLGLRPHQTNGNRAYDGVLHGIDGVAIAFLNPTEIVECLKTGAIHLGVSGLDLLHEHVWPYTDCIEVLVPLSFGFANVVVAVPDEWRNISNMRDLGLQFAQEAESGRRPLRIATKYPNLVQRFFEQHRISSHEIVFSAGATEGTPKLGLADLIVDITTTGATLSANSLKVLDDGTILSSQAALMASRSAKWSSTKKIHAKLLASMIVAEATARNCCQIEASLTSRPPDFLRAAENLFSAKPAFEMANIGVERLLCPRSQASSLASWLISKGAAKVVASNPEYVFLDQQPLHARIDCL